MAWHSREHGAGGQAKKESDVDSLLSSFDEATRIQFLREGIYFGPRAWTGLPLENRRPFDLPKTFDIDSLPAAELKLAVDLGVVAVEYLTSSQRERWQSSVDVDVPSGAAARLLGRLTDGSDESAGGSAA